MSGTESIGTLIIFIGIVLAIGLLFPAVSSFTESVSDSIDSQIDTNREIKNTQIGINATSESNDIIIDVNNTGTTSIFIEDVTVLLDGEVSEPDSFNIDGSNRDILYSGETLVLEYNSRTATRVKVIVQKGVSEIDTNIEVV